MERMVEAPPQSTSFIPDTLSRPSGRWQHLALGGVLLLSVFMNFFQLGQGSFGNLYYASGVRSMTDSLHNFFFVSFDPGGFVTIDKPPLGFWLQAISAKIFGFTAFSIFLPQALCGVLAVLLLCFLVRRHFGVIAGLVAGLALAVTPISVVTNRNNTIDSTLALALLLAAWAVIHAAESGKLRWLLLSGVFVGLGFTIKMAEAYLVLPALLMTYLLCAPRKLWTRVWHLALFIVVLFVVSIPWLLAVDLTPASQRPYVGSTQNNSELNLAFGYNGLNRLKIGGANTGGPGNRGFGQGASSTGRTNRTGSGQNNGALPNADRQPTQAFQGGGGFASGSPSPFRLFGQSLGGQIGWLLPFALLGILALAWQRRWRSQGDHQWLGLILWGIWLLTMATFFSLDGSFHEYYMTELSPGLSAMVGIGLVTMWQDYRAADWKGWLLPLAFLITAGTQIYMLASYPQWAFWMSPLIGILTVVAVIGLIVFRLRSNWSPSWTRIAATGISLGMLALLIAPTVWSGYSVFTNTESSAPTAGPSVRTDVPGQLERTGDRQGAGNAAIGRQFGFNGGSAQVSSALTNYLEANQGNATYLVAAASANEAAPIVLATNKPVMAMGGFSGSDPILTLSDLQKLIGNGTVRFFLVNQTQPGSNQDQPSNQNRQAFAGRGGERQSALTNWVTQHCQMVPASSWQTNGQTSRAGSMLYNCATTHA